MQRKGLSARPLAKKSEGKKGNDETSPAIATQKTKKKRKRGMGLGFEKNIQAV